MESFGDRDIGQGGVGAALVGAPHEREGTGAGGERQRRDGEGISAEGRRRCRGCQYERDVRSSRAIPKGPQARYTLSRGDVSATLPSPKCSFGRLDKVKTTIK